MSHLLDSHACLWCALQPDGLSARVRDLLALPETRCAVSAVSFWGFYAPSGTASSTVDRFVAELAAVLQEDDVKHRLEHGLLVDVTVGGPTVFRAFYQEQFRKWGQVIRENGLKSSS